MFMIAAVSAASSSPPVGALAFVAALGVGAVCYGARYAFDLRGAVGKTLERQRAALEEKGRRKGDLQFADVHFIGAGFFRFIGGVAIAAGLVLLFLSLILAFG